MEGHAKKCEERYFELSHKTTKSQHHALTTINSRKKKWDLLENCQKFAHRLFKTVYTWLVLVDLILCGPWTNFACAITKMDQSLWQTLITLVSYIHHTCEFKQYCHVWNTAQQSRLELFQDSDYQVDSCAFSEVTVQETDFSFTQFYRSWNNLSRCRFTHGWNPSSWSLGFGFWSVSFSPNQFNNTKGQVLGNLSRDTRITKQWLKRSGKAEVQQWDTYPSTKELLLTGCLIELIWTPKIQVKCVDTKHQLADILIKGNFTRDEWNNLLYLFNISHFSSLLRSEFQLDQLHQNDGEKDARTGRRQQDRGKVKADDDEPGLLCLDKFFDSEQSDCVEKPWDTQSSVSNRLVSTGKPDARDRKDDAASSSQGWQKDAFLDVITGKLVATEEDQEHLNYPKASVSTGKLVAPRYPTTYVLHMEKVFSIVRQRYGLSRQI